MYLVDTPKRRVWVYPYDPFTGSLGQGEVLLELAADRGVPDGMTVDESGDLWMALWGGACIVRVGPSGDIRARYPVPASQPTSCTFLGSRGAGLAVSTATWGLVRPTADDGALFLIDVEVVEQ
jgi:sugar lactone lactonase YvrE